jgi:hypothetical protein
MMSRKLVGGLALLLAASFAMADAGASAGRSLPMHFEWHREGPADICSTQCRTWISAIGTITADTPHEFAEFAREHDIRGALLALDSGGGSVHGAMALGRKIRRLGITTTIGKTTRVAGSDNGKAYARLSPQADCESMCAFVLLSGAKRIVPQGARLMVHQIWLGDRRDDAAAATYSAEDLVLVQRDIGKLAQYTIEMGGSIDFLELSLRIPPWEPMRAVTRDEMLRMHVEAGPQPAPAVAAASATAASAPAPNGSGRRGPEAATRGWVMTEDAGHPVLLRSHPLTVEGEEIGSFDIALACGDAPDSLAVSYSEQRLSAGEAAVPLKSVALSLGSRSAPLRVMSSELAPRSLELSTTARGSMPASFIRIFSEARSRALVVSTENAQDTRTTIRVGNSGIGAAFAKLQQICGSHHLHAANSPRTGQSAGR